MPPLIAAGLDSLLTLLVLVIIAAVSSWLKKKGQPEDSESWSEPPASTPPAPGRGHPAPPASTPARPLSWEEELRRLLQGKPAQPSPPVMVHPEPTPPPLQPAPGRPAPTRPTPTRPAPVRPERARPSTARAPTLSRVGRLERQAMHPHVTEVAKQEEAQEKAREQERRVHRQLTTAPASQRQAADEHRAKAMADRLLARAMLRDRQSIRSAIMVSAILGPPRALDDRPAYSGARPT